MTNQRSTFKLWLDNYTKLHSIANQRGIKLSRLVNLALSEWLQQQPDLSKHNAWENRDE